MVAPEQTIGPDERRGHQKLGDTELTLIYASIVPSLRGGCVVKIADFDLKKLLDFQPSQGKLLLGQERMLLFRQDAFAALRTLLYEQLGEALSGALLMQFGYRCGNGDHKVLSTRYEWDTDLDEMSAGPVMHTWEGIVHVEPTLLDYDKSKKHFHMRGIWRNSYEAEIHVGAFGVSHRPVCHSLTGYASGWCSSFFGSPLLAIETMCAGVGDPYCQFEIRPPDRWGKEADFWRETLTATDYSISRELEEKISIVAQQKAAISALSSPIIQIWEGVLTVPIIGTLDEERAAALLGNLLQAVVQMQAKITVLDLTGVDSVNEQAASRFFGIIQAIELIGAQCVITGIKPKVAQAMLSLGLDLSRLTIRANLAEALRQSLTQLGYSIKKKHDGR